MVTEAQISTIYVSEYTLQGRKIQTVCYSSGKEGIHEDSKVKHGINKRGPYKLYLHLNLKVAFGMVPCQSNQPIQYLHQFVDDP